MKVIVDSGSTKAKWAFVDDNNSIEYKSSIGLNPYFVSNEDIVKEIVSVIGFVENVSEIYFYGAGCSTEKNISIIEKSLQTVFDKADVFVYHDMLGAARSTFGKQKGLVAILGTGANTCFYDGIECRNEVPSLGYVLGDEGSAASIGKQVVVDYLSHNMSETLIELFDEKYKINRESILDSVYSQPFANRFLGQFSQFIYEHIESAYCQELIMKELNAFFNNYVLKYSESRSLSLNVVGSVGFAFDDLIKGIGALKGVHVDKIVKDPLPGLIDFHMN